MRIHTHEQLLAALDEIVAASDRGDRASRDAAGFWTALLTREGHPLATDLPDENLVDWQARGLLGGLHGIRILDIGCGGGRNTRWFAAQGAGVDGIDLAADLLDRSRGSMPDGATLTTCDVLRDRLPRATYEFVYDSGCFHHLAPHRRETYLERVLPAVAPGGLFGIVTFAADRVASSSDAEILRSGDVGGGLGYSLHDLTEIFSALQPLETRAVRPDVSGTFGADFLVAALFRRPTS